MVVCSSQERLLKWRTSKFSFIFFKDRKVLGKSFGNGHFSVFSFGFNLNLTVWIFDLREGLFCRTWHWGFEKLFPVVFSLWINLNFFIFPAEVTSTNKCDRCSHTQVLKLSLPFYVSVVFSWNWQGFLDRNIFFGKTEALVLTACIYYMSQLAFFLLDVVYCRNELQCRQTCTMDDFYFVSTPGYQENCPYIT